MGGGVMDGEFRCADGPLGGQLLIRRAGRGAKGVLLVDKPSDQCWIYEWNEERQRFYVRNEDPMQVHTEGPVNRYRAAEESSYDVVAAPWVVSPDDDAS